MNKHRVNTLNKPRVEYIDALKAFAIFCVVYGHLSSNKNWEVPYSNVHTFIYTFHMPLFFIISGLFFNSSLKLNFKSFVLKKSEQLILPWVAWIILFIMIVWVENGFIYPSWPTIVQTFKDLYWFLPSLFICYICAYISSKIFKKKWLACTLSITIILIIPGHFNNERAFLPFFWLGIYLKDSYYVLEKHTKTIFSISAIVFILCLLFWESRYEVYVTKPVSLLIMTSGSIDFNFKNRPNGQKV